MLNKAQSLLVLSVLAFPACSAAESPQMDKGDPCVAARAWLAAHPGTTPTYEDISKYPVECAHSVFGTPPDRCDAAHTWVYEHQSTPTVVTYDELVAYPVECRRFIYGTQSKASQRAMWLTQIERYRKSHLLTGEQESVLHRARDFFSSSRFAVEQGSSEWPATDAELEELVEEATRVFGENEAYMLLAQLGPADAEGMRRMFGK